MLNRPIAKVYRRSTGDLDLAYCHPKDRNDRPNIAIVDPTTVWRKSVGPEVVKNGGSDPDKTRPETIPTKTIAVEYVTINNHFLWVFGASILPRTQAKLPMNCTIEAARGQIFPIATL